MSSRWTHVVSHGCSHMATGWPSCAAIRHNAIHRQRVRRRCAGYTSSWSVSRRPGFPLRGRCQSLKARASPSPTTPSGNSCRLFPADRSSGTRTSPCNRQARYWPGFTNHLWRSRPPTSAQERCRSATAGPHARAISPENFSAIWPHSTRRRCRPVSSTATAPSPTCWSRIPRPPSAG